MSDKTQRLSTHHTTMIELARRGSGMYHYPTLPLTPDQNRKIGQMSLTDGVFIPHEAPPEETSDVGWPE